MSTIGLDVNVIFGQKALTLISAYTL